MTAITQGEFEALGRVRGAHAKELALARALQPMEGFKVPCTYKHYARTCSGISAVGRIGRNAGWTISGRCKDRVLYVFRYA